jgi:ribonuclease BN (tRNA processing enzyme)
MITAEVLYSTSAVGTQILLSHNGQHVLVDMGDGTVRDLVSRRIDFAKIAGVLLTHEHFDHFSGLYSFLHFCRLLGRKEELVLVVPKPARVVNRLLKRPIMYEPLPYRVRLVEIRNSETISIGGVRATGFKVKHALPNAFGFCVKDDEGYRVVLSGDTALCPNLLQNVEGADLAVLEATYDDNSGGLASKYGHMTENQARILGKKARKTIFIHSIPSFYFKKFQCSALADASNKNKVGL